MGTREQQTRPISLKELGLVERIQPVKVGHFRASVGFGGPKDLDIIELDERGNTKLFIRRSSKTKCGVLLEWLGQEKDEQTRTAIERAIKLEPPEK